MGNFKGLGAKGQSALELAVTLPVMIFLLFVTLEWGQIFVKHLRISTLCREAALVANHECKDFQQDANAETNSNTAITCLNRVRDEMIVRAKTVLPNFEGRGDILLSLYGDVQAVTPGNGNFTTHYNSAALDPLMLQKLGTVAVSEVFYNNVLVTPVEKFFDMLMPRLIYKITVA